MRRVDDVDDVRGDDDIVDDVVVYRIVDVTWHGLTHSG